MLTLYHGVCCLTWLSCVINDLLLDASQDFALVSTSGQILCVLKTVLSLLSRRIYPILMPEGQYMKGSVFSITHRTSTKCRIPAIMSRVDGESHRSLERGYGGVASINSTLKG